MDHTYANSLDQTGSCLFYALTAAENMMCFGANVSNAFGDAPPPKQGFFIRPGAAFKEWWISKGRDPIPDGDVIPAWRQCRGILNLHVFGRSILIRFYASTLASFLLFMNHASTMVRLMVNMFCLSAS